ncbi:hypothetical protein K402DRAFT_448145 [Aulographum hederae CBS 113979]|uniref:Uncharacterized protein n=1 Tax=Aulographum hederae CBS 113979 TaxID=1176131 RepID=A0A6G1GS19_9PEZI|nr:hypothetical protein K402DRAFT_448145 [Aulographum hederae CBS 113979]
MHPPDSTSPTEPTINMPGTEYSQTSNASSASSKYDLDDNDERTVLVYKYRGGLKIQSQSDLRKSLEKDLRLRCSRKPIPRGNSRIEVKQEDLYNEPERSIYNQQGYPNMKNSLASIGLPSPVYWKRLLFNQFQDLYIVSPESSPNSSPESSQHVSPSNTFPREGAGEDGAKIAPPHAVPADT